MADGFPWRRVGKGKGSAGSAVRAWRRKGVCLGLSRSG
jgi:hypothetical protein